MKSEKLSRIVEGLEIKHVSPLATPSGIIHHLPPIGPRRSKNEFQQNDTHASTIIANYSDNNQVSHINSCKTSNEAWDDLLCLFEIHDLVIKKYLMEWLTTLKMKENVTKHVHNFKSFFKQLSMGKNLMKNEKVVLALMRNMPPSYQSFLVSIRGQTLTLQTLITYLIQEETLLKSLDNNVEAMTSGSLALALEMMPWSNNQQAPFNSQF